MAYSGDGERDYDMPFLLAIVHRLAIPGIFLVFAVMYFLNTWGRFSLRNLRYPYFVLFILVLFLLLIVKNEVIQLYRDRDRYDRDVTETLVGTWERWEKGIKVIGWTFVYLLLTPYIGIITATFVFLIGGMRIAGVTDWRQTVAVSLGMTIVIYLTFILLLNIRAPTGPWGF